MPWVAGTRNAKAMRNQQNIRNFLLRSTYCIRSFQRSGEQKQQIFWEAMASNIMLEEDEGK